MPGTRLLEGRPQARRLASGRPGSPRGEVCGTHASARTRRIGGCRTAPGWRRVRLRDHDGSGWCVPAAAPLVDSRMAQGQARGCIEPLTVFTCPCGTQAGQTQQADSRSAIPDDCRVAGREQRRRRSALRGHRTSDAISVDARPTRALQGIPAGCRAGRSRGGSHGDRQSGRAVSNKHHGCPCMASGARPPMGPAVP